MLISSVYATLSVALTTTGRSHPGMCTAQCYQWLMPRQNTCLSAETLVYDAQKSHKFCPQGLSKPLLCACLEMLRHFAALIDGTPRCQHKRVPHKCPLTAIVPELLCCTWFSGHASVPALAGAAARTHSNQAHHRHVLLVST
jgi:hypothetical protein